MRNFIVITTIFFTVLPFSLVKGGSDCEHRQGHTRKYVTCQAPLKEVYRDEVPGSKYEYDGWCCVPGSKAYKDTMARAANCRATNCVSPTNDTLCSILGDRYIKGKKKQYEEVMRDPCTREDGSHGVVGVCCQVNSAEGLLVTSLGAEHNEFPHMAKLPGCGGTVYNKRFIITASHCVVSDGIVRNAKGMRVILGTNIAAMDSGSKEYVYEVKRIIPHEEYSKLASNENNELHLPRWQQRFYHDIALLELKKDIIFSEKVKSLEIAPEDFDPYSNADESVIVGWGTTETLQTTIHLQKFNFLLRRDDRCLFKYPRMRGLEETIMCVGGVMDGQHSWTAGAGDSGGPAICRKLNGQPVLCGVTSYGGSDKDCAEYSDEASCPPSVYTEVAYFRDWIEENAGPQDPKTFYQPYLYGKEVSSSEYPHQVHITSSTGKPCGGTLIRPNVVLTAGQCVIRDNGKTKHSDLAVTTDLKDVTGTGNTFKVTEVQLLGSFKKEGEPLKLRNKDIIIATDSYYHNDLAIIKLEKSASVKQDKLPRLPRDGDHFHHGIELAYPRNASRSAQMRYREFNLLERSECQQRMNRISGYTGRDIKVDANLVCGVEKYSGGSTCDRELGGGLICKGAEGKDVLCGVQTFRLCMLSVPNGFVDVTQYGKSLQDMLGKMK